LRDRALKNEAGRASRTFVSTEVASGVVAGYYCLASSSLLPEDATGALKRNMPNPIPVFLLGRLAVDSRFHGVGLGASLLQHAFIKAVEASQLVGAKALLVDAMSESAVSFYRRYGFEPMPTRSERAMYVLMGDAERTIAAL